MSSLLIASLHYAAAKCIGAKNSVMKRKTKKLRKRIKPQLIHTPKGVLKYIFALENDLKKANGKA